MIRGRINRMCIWPGTAAFGDEPVSGRSRRARLQSVQTWMYQNQNKQYSHQAAQIIRRDMPFNCSHMVQTLKTMPSGENRLVRAYVDIGHAENWRTYWKEDWAVPSPRKHGQPWPLGGERGCDRKGSSERHEAAQARTALASQM